MGRICGRGATSDLLLDTSIINLLGLEQFSLVGVPMLLLAPTCEASFFGKAIVAEEALS
jgi:hypothetical protein